MELPKCTNCKKETRLIYHIVNTKEELCQACRNAQPIVFVTSEAFFSFINNLRKNNKNKWYYFTGKVGGLNIELKAYGMWLQIYKVNGVNCSNTMYDKKVSEFKTSIMKPLNNILQQVA